MSNAIRAKLRKEHPHITDEKLNVLLGIFAMTMVYNSEQKEPVAFGEALIATLNDMHGCFHEELIYAYCARRMAEMQEEASPIIGSPKKKDNIIFLG